MSPSIHEIKALIASAQRKHGGKATAIGICTASGWDGPSDLEIGGEHWRIEHASSRLRARRVLGSLAPGERIALLTPLDEGGLGLDVLSRFATARVERVEPWHMVREAFAVTRFDPRLAAANTWLPQVASQLRESHELMPAPDGLLTPEHLWSEVFAWLGLPREFPPIEALLALDAPRLRERWATLPEACRVQGHAWVGLQRGVVAAGVFRCLAESSLPSPIAVGVAIDVLLSPEMASDDAARTRGWIRLEDAGCVPPLGDRECLREWAQLAVARLRALRTEASPEVAKIEKAAREFLPSIVHLENAFEWSSVFVEGLRRRKARAAHAIESLLTSGATRERVETVVAAAAVLRDHLGGEDCDPPLAMAERLSGFLASAEPEALGLAELSAAYRDEASWVDRALARIGEGESEPSLGAAYQRLAAAVRARRDRLNARFGEAVAAEISSDGAGFRSLERALAEVVDPLVKAGTRVLLVVLDGMSWSIAHAIFDWIGRRAALDRVTGDRGGKWKPLLSPLPSITNVARASLLCGELAEGGQNVEQSGFLSAAERFGWKAGSGKGILFHKAGLEGPDRIDIGIRKSIGDQKLDVVAAVVNAIDDQLSTNGQLRPEWTERDLPILKELVDAAEIERRAIVIVADHGHVVDVPGADKVLAEGSGDRWRSAIDPPRPGEVEVSGPRVVLPERGGPIVVPFDDRTRYTARKAGYHGGASPQELVCPMAVFAPIASSNRLPPAWTTEVVPAPAWWSGEISGASGAIADVVPGAPAGAGTAASGDRPPHQAPGSTAGVAWVAALVASETFLMQQKRAGRRAIVAERVQEVLERIVRKGGSVGVEELAVALDATTQRLRSQITAIVQILNVEQYVVLDFNEAANRIALNEGLARRQFGLDDAEGGMA